MKTILIYLLLFTFWAGQVLEFKLTQAKGLSLLNVCIYLLIIAWVISAIRKRKLFEPNNLNKYLIIFVFIVLSSIPIKILLGEVSNISILSEIIAIKSWMNPLILFFIIFNIVDDEKMCKRVILGLVVFLIITVSSVFIVKFTSMKVGVIEVGQTGATAGRVGGFTRPNQYATCLVLFIPLLLSSFLFQRSLLVRTSSAILLIMVLSGLVLTASRGGTLSFLFSMAAYLVILNWQKMMKLRAIMLVAVTMIVLGSTSYVVMSSTVDQTVMDRFDPDSSKDLQKYTSGRSVLWRNGLLLFMKSPIYGHGHNTFMPLMKERFRILGNSHNDYLLHLVHYGIIGLAIFIIIFTKVFQYLWYHLKITTDSWNKGLFIGYLAGFLGYAFSMLGVNVITPRYIFWIYTAVIYKYAQLEMAKSEYH